MDADEADSKYSTGYDYVGQSRYVPVAIFICLLNNWECWAVYAKPKSQARNCILLGTWWISSDIIVLLLELLKLTLSDGGLAALFSKLSCQDFFWDLIRTQNDVFLSF